MKKELFSINISIYSNGEVEVKPAKATPWDYVAPFPTVETKKRGRPRKLKRATDPKAKRKYTKRADYWTK